MLFHARIDVTLSCTISLDSISSSPSWLRGCYKAETCSFHQLREVPAGCWQSPWLCTLTVSWLNSAWECVPSGISGALWCGSACPVQCQRYRQQVLSLGFSQSSPAQATAERKGGGERVKIHLMCFHERALWNMLFQFKRCKKRK